MKTFRSHLRKSLEDKKFKELFDEEKELVYVSTQIQKARKKNRLSQHAVAKAAHLSQQQVSKVENGINCNILTYLKVSRAMGLEFSVHPANN